MKKITETQSKLRLRLLQTVVLWAFIPISSFAQDNTLTAAERAAGWQLLFDGRDISHWRNFKRQGISDKWMAEDGAMTLSAGGGGDILTKQKFKDFDLRLEWKISAGGNSGILILVDEEGKQIYSHAPEIQILDNERHSDNSQASHLSGSLYDMVASPIESHKPAGEWNQVRIVFQAGRIQVWQNAVATVDIEIGSSAWNTALAASKFGSWWGGLLGDWEGFAEAREGYIGLQDHGDKVAFRNIKIKELDE
jgi:hypothetical protein